MKGSRSALGLLLFAAGGVGLLSAACTERDPIQEGDGGATGGSTGGAGSGGAGGKTCTSCPGPAPHSTNFLCPDGVTVGGPVCGPDPSGVCAWSFVQCPPTCVQKAACVQGMHFDSTACACVPDPTTCGPVCTIYCQYGNVLDQNGCPTCKCNPAPGGACDTCPGPAPGAPNFLCPDGVTIGGPACRANADGTCGWIIVQCPPTCVDNVLCVQGLHWDSMLCKCVPDATDPCACPGGQLCVQQIGGPAVQVPPPIACVTPAANCTTDSGCGCLPASEGKCMSSATRTCTCDNGIR